MDMRILPLRIKMMLESNPFPTDIVGFKGFHSSIILILRGGMPRPIGNLPESLSQAILVGCNVSSEIGRIVVVFNGY